MAATKIPIRFAPAAPTLTVPWTGFSGQTGSFVQSGTGSSSQLSGTYFPGVQLLLELGTGSFTNGAALNTLKGAASNGSGRGMFLASAFTTVAVEQNIRIPLLSTSGEQFNVMLGFANPASIPAFPGYGVYGSINGAALTLVAKNNNVDTTGPGSFTVIQDQTFNVRIVWNVPTATAQLYVNGALISTLTTGVPTSTTVAYEPHIRLTKSAGTTNRMTFFGMGSFTANY